MTEMEPVTQAGYSSLEDVRHFIGVPLSRVSDSDILAAVQMGDSQINLLTGRTWNQTIINEQLHNTTGYDTLRIHGYPVISISKLEVWREGQWTELTAWDPNTRAGVYRMKKARSGILEFITSAPSRMRDGARVSYTHGYVTVPGYIRDLSIRMASIIALQIDAGQVNPSGFQSVSEGGLSISWGSGAHDGRIKLLIQETEKMLSKIGGKLEYAWINP